MNKYLTAEQAYDIATKWQENEVSDYVAKTLKDIESRARQGYFYTRVGFPSTNVNHDGCTKALEELGYQIKRDGFAWVITWKKEG